MSNVEYRCPICQARLFAAPGGTKLKCPRHTEQLFMQVEEYDGPDFLYVDEQGNTVSSDLIGKHNDRTSIVDRGEITVNPDAELIATRTLYRTICGMNPDMRWGVGRINDEMREFLTATLESTGGGNEQEVNQESETPVVPDDADDTLADAPSDGDTGDKGESEPESPTEPGVLVPDIPPPDSPQD